VFLQQLGRGLRLSSEKECCTVLDFIGGAHRKFRFDARYRALLGGTRRSVERQIENGFPQLPSGCVIQLDRQSEKVVLENIRQAVGRGRKALVEDLRALGDVSLSKFLQETGFELEDVYEGGGCFTDLRRLAELERRPTSDEDLVVERAFSRMIHVDDFARLDAFMALTAGDGPVANRLVADDTDAYQRLLFVLLGQSSSYNEMQARWDRLWRSDWLRRELRELLVVLADRCRRVSFARTSIALADHATYSRFEVMAAADERTKKGGVKKTQTGVYYVAPLKTDLLFVTLHKDERAFTATTMYRDYPISASLFHWESQSTCHPATKTGARYLNVGHGAQEALLFVRERQRDERGSAMAYMNLGAVRYRRHEGERPMRIEWEMQRPMPAEFFQAAKLAAG
jgi:hypothetical protein